jgi:uncharacterized protein
MIIDSHVHLLQKEGYLDSIIKVCDNLGIDRVCLLGGPSKANIAWGNKQASNEEVIKAYERYPDRVIPFAFFNLGVDSASLVDRYHEMGFRGLKMLRPAVSYDDKSIYPVYERTSILHMPILFHLGTVARTEGDQHLDVQCDRMRPIRLDTLARAFPEQNFIGAHLGNPWYEEAAMSLFWNSNLYFDLSGTTLKRKTANWFKDILWWDSKTLAKLAPASKNSIYPTVRNQSHPWERICFGTDVPPDEMPAAFEDYQNIMQELDIPEEVRRKVMGGNLESILYK